MNKNAFLKQRILLLLATGVALGFSGSPSGYFKILRACAHDWREINKSYLWSKIREFYDDRLVDFRDNDDGTTTIILTEDGKKRILQYEFESMKMKKPKVWKGDWHIVTYDIPEKKKPAREAFRKKVKELGMLEFQRSVFVSPYECENEIDFVAEFFEVGKYVRYIKAKYITNEAELKEKFGLY
ncbi:MAG: CRISPR-associated endonuclease Cas2 [Candidatus Niyogibacteria bacterium RIFCSPLOWO2_01_FULL_45_48]|uniref:CRISPR-associated endonuclease Cas2 n=1 Tax=Candidatus Niyogibacteria bacterium RIFCSPLOWO2_01_FULL_45_48 TaxID=1801724 RepID=A0A1G2F060_9BACT|nr:MAG: CRISPR-associated endonuclease Cas2 [Candidatus Niyogibacteria bacterium RIFCSPLOWO2_01_FULL_45_48]OGZ31106.1 MAG: CRISPR-associated endonuclease Cas2 [Candidatus Niyogibacteria bacterium RIFCSPHIGHO2_01_FULL_45_28]